MVVVFVVGLGVTRPVPLLALVRVQGRSLFLVCQPDEGVAGAVHFVDGPCVYG